MGAMTISPGVGLSGRVAGPGSWWHLVCGVVGDTLEAFPMGIAWCKPRVLEHWIGPEDDPSDVQAWKFRIDDPLYRLERR